jgi:hypothetical protein
MNARKVRVSIITAHCLYQSGLSECRSCVEVRRWCKGKSSEASPEVDEAILDPHIRILPSQSTAQLPTCPLMSTLTVPDVVSGHQGHLSSEQTAALDTFRNSLSKAGLWTPETGVDEPTLMLVNTYECGLLDS